MKVLIATPAYGRIVTLDFMLAVRSLEKRFGAEGIVSDLALTIGSVLPRSRGALAGKVLADPSYDYLLFIDSDMSFQPEAVMKLLRSGKEVCGCVCPSRHMNVKGQHAAARLIEDPTLARNVGQDYISMGDLLQREEGGVKRLVKDGDLYQISRIGFGITAVKRSALEKMRDRFPDLVLPRGSHADYISMGADYDILQVFDGVRSPGGMYMGEDYCFSSRWTDGCGGEVWAVIDEEIGHVGMSSFQGRPTDRLRAQGVLLD